MQRTNPLVSVIMGTRPEIIKMAPVVHALKAIGMRVEVIHTGQHEEMAWPIYEFFGIQPDHLLQVTRNGLGLPGLTSQLQLHISELLHTTEPSVVLVHGDTSSAAMGALAAAFSEIPVGHVEAGLRSGRIDEPFPEEINRNLIGRVAHWHFAPTKLAQDNLLRDNVPGEISVVGNTVVDAVSYAAARIRQKGVSSAAIDWWRDSKLQQLVLVTAHRRENWGLPMQRILAAVQELLANHPQAGVIWPVHLNPIVKDAVHAAHAAAPAAIQSRWHLSPPVDYPEMVGLMDLSALLLTDSGGIQEEGLSLGKPLLVMREVTERPEVIACGMGVLVGTDVQRIVDACHRILNNGMVSELVANPFGDGTSGQQIAALIQQSLSAQTSAAAAAETHS